MKTQKNRPKRTKRTMFCKLFMLWLFGCLNTVRISKLEMLIRTKRTKLRHSLGDNDLRFLSRQNFDENAV